VPPIPEPERVTQSAEWNRWCDDLTLSLQGEVMATAPRQVARRRATQRRVAGARLTEQI
jgi:hypothetical protein